MTLSRRTLLKLGVGTGAVPLLNAIPFAKAAAQPSSLSSRSRSAEDTNIRARPLPLAGVRLTGGPLRHAQELDMHDIQCTRSLSRAYVVSAFRRTGIRSVGLLGEP